MISQGDQGQPFACDQCGRRYKWKMSLINHKKKECGKQPNLQCPLCTYVTKIKSNLKRHLHTRHSDLLSSVL